MNFLHKKRERLGEREFRRVYLKDKLKICIYIHVGSGRYPLDNSLDIYFQERVLIPSLLR